ncbi:hypothetical protein D3C80_2104540 [compost metagenome]
MFVGILSTLNTWWLWRAPSKQFNNRLWKRTVSGKRVCVGNVDNFERFAFRCNAFAGTVSDCGEKNVLDTTYHLVDLCPHI